METYDATQPRFADYSRPLLSRWWMILLAVVIATGGVYAFYARKANVYTATTSVYYHDPGDPVTGAANIQSTDRNVADEAALLYSRDTAALVAKRIGYVGSAGALLDMVTISSKPGEDFVEVTAQAGNANQAATVANAFAAQLVDSLDGGVSYRIASALKLSRTQMAALPRGITGEAQRASLADQINRLELALRVPSTIARQVDTALPPAAPSAPKPVRNALFAFALSLVAVIALAYGLERFDRRLKNPDELERAYGSPLLAVLPHAGDPAPELAGEPVLGSDFREPFRVLRTNVELAAIDRPPRTIVISSAVPGEGKSTVVRNLALAFRETGRRVAVVDLDLRHPSVADLFGVPHGRGMTDVLRGELDIDDAALKIGVGVPASLALLRDSFKAQLSPTGGNGGHGTNGNGSSGANGNGHGAHGSDITLLLSGPRPANPPAVLSSERLIQVLEVLRDDHDVVLIDSAPVLAVTDTVPLLRWADASLFVSRLDVTTRDTAKRLMEFLDRIPDANMLGIVANDLSRTEANGYGYGYGYSAYEDESRGRRKRAESRAEQPA